MRNGGNTVWSAQEGFALAITHASWAEESNRIALGPGAAIQPGDSHVFKTILGPRNAGEVCSISFRMVQENVEYFGDELTLERETTPAADDALYLGNTVPPRLSPGESVGVGIWVRNTGNTHWIADGADGYQYRLARVTDPDGLLQSDGILIAHGKTVAKGEAYQFIGQITAPLAAGEYGIELQMADPVDGGFGPVMELMVRVEPPPNSAREWSLYD
jgi:hypothetical protein